MTPRVPSFSPFVFSIKKVIEFASFYLSILFFFPYDRYDALRCMAGESAPMDVAQRKIAIVGVAWRLLRWCWRSWRFTVLSCVVHLCVVRCLQLLLVLIIIVFSGSARGLFVQPNGGGLKIGFWEVRAVLGKLLLAHRSFYCQHLLLFSFSLK